MADLIEEGVTGLLYPYGDVKRFVECVERVQQGTLLFEKKIEVASKTAEKYSIDKVLSEVIELYLD